jgi:ribosomal protein L37AE/L43A
MTSEQVTLAKIGVYPPACPSCHQMKMMKMSSDYWECSNCEGHANNPIIEQHDLGIRRKSQTDEWLTRWMTP